MNWEFIGKYLPMYEKAALAHREDRCHRHPVCDPGGAGLCGGSIL